MSEIKKRMVRVKQLLEMYQKDLLEVKSKSGGDVVRLRCELSDLINFFNFKIGNITEVIAYELGNKQVGKRISDLQEFPKKTNKEIIEFIETSLYTTGLPSYVLDPICIGFSILKEREK